MSLRRALALLAITSAAFACTPESPPPATPPQPTAEPAATAAPKGDVPDPATHGDAPEAACKGHVDSPPAGLAPLEEPAPAFALGQPGKGALCEAKVFTAKEPVTVYRAFSASYESSKRAGPLGAYWTFQKPRGKASEYRATYEICAEWNDLDMLNECTIDVGAKVVLGPGQSAQCDGGKDYPQSPANQVLIVRGSDGKVPVANCKQSALTWGE